MEKPPDVNNNTYRLPPTKKFEAGLYVRLTDRDMAIAHDIFLNKVVSVPQIRRMHFPDVAPDNWAPISRRMSLLEELGHVRVTHKPGQRANLYVSGPEYIRIAAKDANRHPGYMYREHMREVTEFLALEHRLLLNDIFSFFRREEAREKGELLDWVPEPGTRLKFKHQGRTVSIMPDCKGMWWSAASERCIHFLGEVDRGTMRLELMRDKFQRYLLLLLRLGFARVNDRAVFPAVLIIANSARRAASLADCVKAAAVQIGLRAEDASRFIVFGVSDVNLIENRGILDDVWQILLDETRGTSNFNSLLSSDHLFEDLGLHFRIYDRK